MIKPTQTIALPATVGIGEAETLHDQLLAAAADGQSVVVNGAAVKRITTPAIQVLLACARSIGPASFRVSAASENMRAAFGLLGLALELEAWLAARG